MVSAAPTERTPLLNAATQETNFSVPNGALRLDQSGNNAGTGDQARRTAAPSSRQYAPDLLRGLLNVIMASDHVNFMWKAFPHGTRRASESASQPVHSWVSNGPYIMRTLTHLCAPGFALLLGMGVILFMQSRIERGWSSRMLISHIIGRTIGIIIANTITVPPLLAVPGVYILNIVLWALAIDYLLVGILAVLLAKYIEPTMHKLMASFGRQGRSGEQLVFQAVNVALLAASALTIWWNIWLDPDQGSCQGRDDDRPQPCPEGVWNYFVTLLFHGVSCGPISSGFPPLAWISFPFFGAFYGRLLLAQLRKDQSKPGHSLSPRSPKVTMEAAFSIVFALLFVATRVFNFGNLSTHCLDYAKESSVLDITLTGFEESQKSPGTSKSNAFLYSLKSFFYIVKYPPSPAFAFFTLSGNFALLVLFALISSTKSSPARLVRGMQSDLNPLLVFGRQPLFFYWGHLTLIRLSWGAFGSYFAHTIPAHEWDGKQEMLGIGFGPVFFGVYAVVVAVMYPLCYFYGRFKSSRPNDSFLRFL